MTMTEKCPECKGRRKKCWLCDGIGTVIVPASVSYFVTKTEEQIPHSQQELPIEDTEELSPS